MNVDRLLEWPFKDVVQSYTIRDTMFYALSVGFGADPTDEKELRYVFEKNLVAVPSMGLVLGRPEPFWADPKAEIDWAKIVFGEQSLEIHRQLPVEGTVRARERVAGMVDKGKEKGAVLFTERHIVDDKTGDPLATLRSSLFCRGDGGFGGSRGDVPQAVYTVPESNPDRVAELVTLPQAALFYRLTGDMNPLHADPERARQVGFQKPILHGLCSYGFAVHAILKLWCDYEPVRFKSVTSRFSAPIYPGETFLFETWKSADGKGVLFRGWCKERKSKVLDSGYAVLAD
ncbi:MAG: MaoC/PaaZ C-terminal domain-containing protein [Smithellaceae bacterium]